MSSVGNPTFENKEKASFFFQAVLLYVEKLYPYSESNNKILTFWIIHQLNLEESRRVWLAGEIFRTNQNIKHEFQIKIN